MNTFYDISAKIDQPTLDLFSAIDAVLKDIGVAYFLIGARARDIVLTSIFNIRGTRATLDYNFAVSIAAWNSYEEIVDQLVRTGAFQRDAHVFHRLLHSRIKWIDFVPFGPIQNPPGEVRWPSDFLTVFNTSGFQEAYDAAMTVRLRSVPPLDLKVCTPAGLAILKVFAWSGRDLGSKGKDAEDLGTIMYHYFDIISLGEVDADLPDADFDYELAGARMLGRHMGNIADPDTTRKLLNVLLAETGSDGYRLASDLRFPGAGIDDTENFEYAMRMLRAMVQGIQDRTIRK